MVVHKLASRQEWDDHMSSDKVIIVDFHAEWCGPCVFIAPTYETLSNKYSDLVFLKVDVDALRDISSECQVNAMPTFHAYKGGQKIGECVGANKENLEKLIVKAMESST